MITPFFKERSGREGMTVVSVLLGAAVEVGVGSNPTIAKFIHGTCRYSCLSTVFCRVLGLLSSRYFKSIACSLIKRINLPMESNVA